MKKILALILTIIISALLFSCGEKTPIVEEEKKIELGILEESLEDSMKSMFCGDTVLNETVMFIDKLEVKTLLFDIDTIISVTSYDGKTTYEEGTDYDVIDGKIRILQDSKIPCITAKKYYNVSDGMLYTEYNGKNVKTYWGEGTTMTMWQVCVNYTHKDAWNGFKQPCNAKVYEALLEKLKNKEDVTFFFYGDSITYGANSSYIVGTAPKQHSYSMLFTESIADLFGYRVKYTSTSNLANTCNVPKLSYNKELEPTITYINTAVGGWTTQNGATNFNKYVGEYIDEYGCDLFVLAFGMNDQAPSGDDLFLIQKQILDGVLEKAPNASLMIVSTMLPNPNATNGWFANQQYQEAAFLTNVETTYKANNIPCSVAQVTSMSKAVLERKAFQDYTGNNINHPNDMMTRIYAQTLLQNFIGYDNMD